MHQDCFRFVISVLVIGNIRIVSAGVLAKLFFAFLQNDRFIYISMQKRMKQEKGETGVTGGALPCRGLLA
jgi:hypothetical protein